MKNNLASCLNITLARWWFRHRELEPWAPARISFPCKEKGGHNFVRSRARKGQEIAAQQWSTTLHTRCLPTDNPTNHWALFVTASSLVPFAAEKLFHCGDDTSLLTCRQPRVNWQRNFLTVKGLRPRTETPRITRVGKQRVKIHG